MVRCKQLEGVNTMKQMHFSISAILLVISAGLISGQEKTISADDLSMLINDCQHDSNYILLDVRDVGEVENGIIASAYCKPYHMSWNANELQNNYTVLPDDVPIYIYCRSGNRSRQAATFLNSNGYTQVYSMSGGINAYRDSLYDSTEFKIWNNLPAPSFLSAQCTTALNTFRTPKLQKKPLVNGRKELFTLQGRRVTPRPDQQQAPVFILERIEGESGGKVRGVHRLIQKTE